MIREDVGWLLPVVVLALYQVKVVWGRLTRLSTNEVEMAGEYSDFQRVYFYLAQYLVCIIFIVQLSFPVLMMVGSAEILMVRMVGYILVLVGFFISLRAVKDLGRNWAGMYHYCIKKGQRLVVTGIYGQIRHPIYLALMMEITGFELVANSWLVIILPIGVWLVVMFHISREDELLKRKFGKEYVRYKKITGAFFPKLTVFNN